MTRRTKIVATIGPASHDPATLRSLVEAGVNVVRLNLSHGDAEEHLGHLANVRRVAADLDAPIAVLADLPGPKIRSGEFPEDGVHLMTGATVEVAEGRRAEQRTPDPRRLPRAAA